MTEATARDKLRSRLILLLIVAMFFSSFGIAAYLRFTGWMPGGHGKNIGELMQPPKNLAAIALKRADGSDYAWTSDNQRWQIVFVAPQNCGAPCAQMLDTLHRLWLSEGRLADRVQVVWFGDLPANAPRFRMLVPMAANPQFLQALPDTASAQALPVYLVDPTGYLVMRYPPGFEPGGLRKDLAQLLK